MESAAGDAEADHCDNKTNDDSDGHECSSPISDRPTETVTECERHLGFRCGPEDSGATTSGPTWGSVRSLSPLGDPWLSEPRPCQTLARQARQDALMGAPEDARPLAVRVCPACRFAW